MSTIPSPPFPYIQTEVLLNTADVQLAGTLIEPPLASTAALLIPGSGDHDRDETVAGHRPFWVLADALARAGIASLRLDDRGVGGSSGDKTQSTHTDLVGDIRTAIGFLRNRGFANIGLIGHSEGSVLAAKAAAELRGIAWIVLLCGPGLPAEAVIHQQAADITATSGGSAVQIAHERRMNEAVFALMKTILSTAEAKTKAAALIQGFLREWPDAPPMESAEIEHNASLMAETVSQPIFRSLLKADPSAYLRQVRCPVLALFGELDIQVEAKTNLAAVKEALRNSPSPHPALEILPQLNHLLQTATTGAMEEYEQLEETIAPIALQHITGWITRQSRT